MYCHPENQALYIFTSRHHLAHKFHQVAGDKLIDGN
jgi:hypothetical protein